MKTTFKQYKMTRGERHAMVTPRPRPSKKLTMTKGGWK